MTTEPIIESGMKFISDLVENFFHVEKKSDL